MALVAKRYRVTRQQIVEIAPLLFFIAAEQCLRERKERLEALGAALKEAHAVAPSHLPLEFYDCDDDVWDAERQSIETRDLFGSIIAASVGLDGKDEAKDNPFARFLAVRFEVGRVNHQAIRRTAFLDQSGK